MCSNGAQADRGWGDRGRGCSAPISLCCLATDSTTRSIRNHMLTHLLCCVVLPHCVWCCLTVCESVVVLWFRV